MKLATALTLSVLMTGSAFAGDLVVLSMHHSADHFVPHLRFDGVIERGDAENLADMLGTIPRCTESCEGATAVLSLDSPGGNYLEALAMTELLRREHVATVIQADAQCLSACLTVFTGGTRRTFDDAAPDRIYVPGGQIGLFPLDRPSEDLATALFDGGLDHVQGAPLAQLQAMAQDGSLGISTMLSDRLAPTGSVYEHDLTQPGYLATLGATLPPADLDQLAPDHDAALLQACAHALAQYYGRDGVGFFVADAEYQIDPAVQRSLGSIGNKGYRVQDSEVSFCTGDLDNDPPHRVWLFGPGADGTEELSGMDLEPHMVFPVSEPTAALERAYAPYVDAWMFKERPFATEFPEESDTDLARTLGIEPILTTLSHRVSRYEDVLIFEQVGGSTLGESLASYLKSPALIEQAIVADRGGLAVRATHADTGNAVFIAAITGRNDNWLGQVELGVPWSAVTAEQEAMIAQWSCNFSSVAEQKSCD